MQQKFPNHNSIQSLITQQIKYLWQSSTQRVMSITAVGMGLALVADILIAAKLGATTQSDVLIIALTVPRIIEVIAREGTKFSLVSLLVEIEQTKSIEEYYYFTAVLFNLALIVGCFLVILSGVLASSIIQLTGPGLNARALTQAILLFKLSLPLSLFAILSTVLSVFLNSQKHFAVTAARNMSMPTAVILLMLLNWQNSKIAVWIAVGHTIGYLFYFIYLLIYSYKKTAFRLSWRARPNGKIISQLKEAVLYPSMGLAVRQSLRIAERALASLTAPGGVAAYYFAYRLISSIQTIVGVSLATTKLPTMSRMVAKHNRKGFEQSLKKQIWQVSLICLPITLVVVIFHTLIIQLLYGRGAFNEGSVAQTGQILQVLGISVFFLSLIPTLNAALYALQKYKMVWWNQALNTAVMLILAWTLSMQYGIIGIAAAFVIAAIFSVVVQLFLLRYNRVTYAIVEV